MDKLSCLFQQRKKSPDDKAQQNGSHLKHKVQPQKQKRKAASDLK